MDIRNFLKSLVPNSGANAASSSPTPTRPILAVDRFTEASDYTMGNNEDASDGLILSGHYLPEELVQLILSFLPASVLTRVRLVCRTWNCIVISPRLWQTKYERHYNKVALPLPWYVFFVLFDTGFFDTNLVRNPSGQNQLEFWLVTRSGGDKFIVEETPQGADALPSVFGRTTQCFATSYQVCSKQQRIALDSRPVYMYILRRFKPRITVSDWVAGRFDCGCVYNLHVNLVGKDDQILCCKEETVTIDQWAGGSWQKVELVFDTYPDEISGVLYTHHGKDRQFWAGHYGPKMSGASVTMDFSSLTLEPKES